MSVTTISVGDVRLIRLGYADVSVEPAAVGLTPAQVAAVQWAQPPWTDGEQVRVGAAAWVIESGDARIVVDPAQAVDAILRNDADAARHQEAFAALLESSGFPRQSFTLAIATHLDGIGMLAWRSGAGAWVPFFPNAPILMSQRELDRVDMLAPQGSGVLAELRAQGAVRALTGDQERVTDEVLIEFTGGHSLGHQIVRIDSRGEHAVMLGHLAVSVLHLAREQCPAGHERPDEANAWIDKLLAADALLIGPLWPAPGAGRWEDGKLVPAGS